jgi:RHS repeat-associated protein
MYTGREYDRGLKLYYNRARYYDPKLARFISRDPIDIADDVNLYAYVGNNSVMFVDLMGMEKDLVINKKTLERINGLHPFIRERVEDFIREVYKEL